MRANECCHSVDEARTGGGGPRLRSAGRRGAKAAGWVLPSAVMVLMPKCPMCVALYVAMVTGAGISMSRAAELRVGVLILCAIVLAFVAVKAFWGGVHDLNGAR